jgi:hypothetical protein
VSRQRRIAWLLGALAVLWVIGRVTDGPEVASTSPGSAASGSVAPSPTATSPTTPAAPSSRPPAPGPALAALGTLAVKGRAPMTGYDRARFGQPWLDADRNGCDTRNDILRRDVASKVIDPRTHGCVVLTGVLPDPYLGRDVPFVRGAGDQVDIDHVVSLGNAWATGAARVDIRRRAAFANDPFNLLAVDLHTNRSKGDGDAATWLPPYRPFRCAYVARQIAVKQKYRLWVTPAERAAMARVLSGCPGQRLPRDRTHAPTSVDQDIAEPSAVSSSGPSSGPSHPVGLVAGATYYANCDAVRAAGAAPIRVGDPGYGRHLDRDGDGVGCE